VQPDFLAAAQAYFGRLDIRTRLLVAPDAAAELALPTAVEEYEAWQRSHMDETSTYLRVEYITRVGAVLWELMQEEEEEVLGGGVLLSTPRSLGTPRAKGKPTEAQLRTKALLPRFARMLSAVMTDQLRTVVLSSVQTFRDFWAAYAMTAPFELGEDAVAQAAAAAEGGEQAEADRATAMAGGAAESPEPEAEADAEAEVDAAADETAEDSRKPLPDLGLKPFSRADAADCDSYTPLYQIDLTVADGAIVFEPSLEQLQMSVLELFDNVCGCVVGISDIRNKLDEASGDMSNAHGSMATVAPHEPPVVEARAFVEGVLADNSVGPRALAASYEQYAELLAADADDYAECWKMRFATTAETEEEILRVRSNKPQKRRLRHLDRLRARARLG
jgi:hypothetical protein